MLVLDTDLIRSDLLMKGFIPKDVEDTVKTFAPYEGIEVRLYTNTGNGFIPNTDKYMEIPRTWLRYERGIRCR